MPPSSSKRRAKRGTDTRAINNASAGVFGRKTGITLEDLGPRDEFGLEPSNIFQSSPAKEPPTTRQRNATRKDDTSPEGSMSMVIEDSPVEVADYMQRRSQSHATPVRSSPFKHTNMTGSPQRISLPRQPSQSPFRADTPERVTPQPSPRRLNLSMEQPRPSVEKSPRRRTIVANNSSLRPPPRSIYSLSKSPEKLQTPVQQRSSALQASIHRQDVNVEYYDAPGLGDDEDAEDATEMDEEPLEAADIENLPDDEPTEEDEADSVETPSQHILSNPSRQARRSNQHEARQASNSLDEEIENDIQAEDAEPIVVENGDGEDEPEVIPAQESVPKKRGRPPKSGKPKAKAPPKSRQPLAKKNANARVAPNGGSAKSGPRQGNIRERHETPANDTLHTRSGRVVYAPLEFWKGERVIRLASRDQSSRAITESIQEIVRYDDVTPAKRTRSVSVQPHPRRKRRRQRANAAIFDSGSDEDEIDPENVFEEWELEEGVQAGNVRVWDEEVNQPTADEREQEIAFAARHIVTRDVPGADFRYAKMLTMPFFGSGMVELPPRGFKRMKNSRRMQMVFFVHTGKVGVEVAGTRFIISKGGVWQVPRGNFYSITNDTDYTAKLFFAQGCEVQPAAQQQGPAAVAAAAAAGGTARQASQQLPE